MINLKFQYKRLFTLNINHNYYPDNIASDLYLIPTSRTAKLIDKMSMLIRKVDGGIHILYDASNLEMFQSKLKQLGKDESKLSFMVYSTNQYFVNISNIPVDLSNKVFYFSNKELGIKSEGKLHKDEFVNAKNLFNVSPIIDNTDDELNFKLDTGNKIGEEISYLNKDQVDFTKLIEGNYKIFGNDRELAQFINLESKLKGSPVGFIDIFLNDDFKKQLDLELDQKEVREYKYQIDFDSRSIYWKYIVVPSYIKRVKALAIVNAKGKEKISFKALGEETIQDKKAHTFISDKMVKFNKFYDYELQLKKKEGEGGGKTIVKKLPFTSFEILKPHGDEYMSEIYIYI